jgi:hypothetical protein
VTGHVLPLVKIDAGGQYRPAAHVHGPAHDEDAYPAAPAAVPKYPAAHEELAAEDEPGGQKYPAVAHAMGRPSAPAHREPTGHGTQVLLFAKPAAQ